MVQEFFLMGVIIVLGFISLMFFERTKIPDVLLLMLLGVLLGPVLNFVDTSATSIIMQLAPFVGTLALIILLFDGGMNLNIFKVVKEFGKASVFTVLVFIVSVVLVGFAMKILVGWQLIHGLLLGAVVGGSSSAIVISIIGRTSMSEDNKTILTLESALTDALCVIAALLLIQISISQSVDFSIVGNWIASAFSIAVVVGLGFAIAWITLLQRFYGKPFGYLLTIATLFILYAFVEYVRGNGAIAVLVFGISLSSMQELAKRFKIEGDFKLDDRLRQFQVEVSFFVRTFFFVFLGLIINLYAISANILVVGLVILALLVSARVISVKLLSQLFPEGPQNILIISMLPRGLAAAVLAFLPLREGIILPAFSEIVFLIIVFTNVVATTGVYWYETNTGLGKPRVIEVKTQRYPHTKKA